MTSPADVFAEVYAQRTTPTTGLFIPSVLLNNPSIPAEDKLTASVLLQYLIVDLKGVETTSLFPELAIALSIPESDIIRCVNLLADMNLLSCFSDRYNLGGDKTLYVGHWTQDAYWSEVRELIYPTKAETEDNGQNEQED